MEACCQEGFIIVILERHKATGKVLWSWIEIKVEELEAPSEIKACLPTRREFKNSYRRTLLGCYSI